MYETLGLSKCQRQTWQEGESIAHIQPTPEEPDIRHEPNNGPPTASLYTFRSTQASTVLIDPRVETLSISFHDGSSLGSVSASNTGVAKDGSNLALGGSGTSTLPNGYNKL
ncbi:hypothetical protein SeLEV6574_g08546 [Synchytrium endobioticum]|uniref:Uncharacterized protein n=1 Tax=Synchytrium endobioticum TaxID=286115 RepID=A0A507BZW2_9FUNG|nr:hypothetical protein SeLEV6574_g08546 [Synchytrium endobioticum]